MMSDMVETAKGDTSMMFGMVRTMMGNPQMMQMMHNKAGNGMMNGMQTMQGMKH
ncbi:MAG: hypothetical protein M3Z56_11225 [Bacteroidota bacterium]|nr:hypothetical protein [Bacteroidota bacterium]